MHLIKIKLVVVLLLLVFTGKSQEVKRVISLTPSITENIYLIGAEDKLVGCTSYCKPALKDGKEQVGSAINVNIEKVFALQPDLVLTMGLTKPQDVAAMKKLGIKVELIETPTSFTEICEQTLHIAHLLGHSTKAQIVVNEAKMKVDAIQEKCAEFAAFNVFFQIGSSPIFTVLQNTFMDDFITFCQGKNISGGMQHGTITRENVLLKNPDVIILSSMGGFGEKEKEAWQKFAGLSAVKKNKVFLVNEEKACSPTPANFADALEEIYQNIIQ